MPRSASCLRTRAPAGDASCCAEPRGRHLVHLEQRLALRRARALLVASASQLRHRHAEPLRQHADGFGEADLLVQLHELDHVAADAAAEAVEEALLAVDVERRRLLAVERAQPLPGRARSASSDTTSPITCTMSACRCRSSRKVCGNGHQRRRAAAAAAVASTSFLQLHDGDAAAALLERRRVEVGHQRMRLEEAGDRLLQPPRAVPVNQRARCADRSRASRPGSGPPGRAPRPPCSRSRSGPTATRPLGRDRCSRARSRAPAAGFPPSTVRAFAAARRRLPFTSTSACPPEIDLTMPSRPKGGTMTRSPTRGRATASGFGLGRRAPGRGPRDRARGRRPPRRPRAHAP